MRYVFECELFKGEQQWCVFPFGLPGATQGESLQDACESAADSLQEVVRDMLMHGEQVPAPTFGNELEHGGERLVVSFDASLDDVRKVSAAQAARMLGVSRSRVTALVKSRLLDGWTEGRNSWVTLDSIEARLADAPSAGRPAKQEAAVADAAQIGLPLAAGRGSI